MKIPFVSPLGSTWHNRNKKHDATELGLEFNAQFSVFDKEMTSTKPAPNLQTHINSTGRISTCCISEVGLRTASRLFGCSDEFWNNVIKPFHGAMACTVSRHPVGRV